MEIGLSVADPARVGACVDLVVTAEPGTPLSAVRDALLAAVGTDPASRTALHCDGRPLDPAAPLGVRPLLDGVLLSVGPDGIAPGSAAGCATAGLELHVVAGPDAGAALPLPPGTWTVGRDAASALPLLDPDVSRRHAELEVGTSSVVLRDLGSTNGTSVGARPVAATVPVAVQPGVPITLGRSTLLLRGPAGVPACCVPDGQGHELVNRAPRMGAGPVATAVHFPAHPPRRPRARMPWPAILLPALVAVPLAVFWRQPVLLLLGLLGPLILLAQVVLDRRSGRRDDAAAGTRHAAASARADADLARALADDLAARERQHPDLAELARIARGPTDRIWERRLDDEDALQVRLGRGRTRSAVTVHRPPDAATGQVTAPGGAPAEHPDAPVTVNLRAAGVLGICGPREAVLGTARALLGQVAVLHSPSDLVIVPPAAGGPGSVPPAWSWLRWLPHCHQPDVRRTPEQHLLAVVDGMQQDRSGALAEALAGGPDRLSVLCLEADAAALPVQCTATLLLAADGSAVLRRRHGPDVSLRSEGASARWVHRLARDLAPLRDGAPAAGALPASVRLPPLLGRELGIDPLDADELCRLWSDRPARAVAVLGTSEHGTCTVDLDADGPHLLVAGTTGAGKSELLQCLVSSLAVANTPDELAFVLVDYKGGTAFAGCAGLPHVTGLVTDLDAHLTRRALTSLAAELRRRERMLRAAAVPDLAGYAGCRRARGLPALPRLVLVIDEFRVLAEELPEFVAGLVRIAAVGRSLGVHLVLATQRPAGAVSADIRANVNLRIALRVRDREDSLDVVDAPDAALLPAATAGRAVLRAGAGPLRRLQTAHVTAPHAPPPPPSVRHLDTPAGPEPALEAGAPVPSDLELLVRATQLAVQRAGLAVPPAAWLPPLPDSVLLNELDELSGLDEPAGTPGAAVPFGLGDHPGRQQQTPICWRLDTGSHCAVVGGPRSGRTSTMRAIAVSAASRIGPEHLHLHVIGGSDELAPLQHLPHTGTVVPVRDLPRVERLLQRLLVEVGTRQQHPSPHRPLIVLLVDGWEALADAAGLLQPRAVEDVLRVLRDGAAVGVRVVISGGRGLLTGPVGALLGERIVLRMTDPVDAVLAGVPTGSLPERMPPGRAVRLGGDDPSGTELQVALLAPDPAAPAQDAALVARAAALRPAADRTGLGRTRPWRIRDLPARVDRRRLDHSPDPRAIPIGIGGDDALTQFLDLRAAPGQLVLGAGGSGRSTALASLGAGLLATGAAVLVVAVPTSPLAALAGCGARLLDPLGALPSGGHTHDGTRFDDCRLDNCRLDVLVDDAGALPPALDDWLSDLATRAAAGRGGSVSAAAGAAQAAGAYRGLLSQLRRHRSGLLLGPTTHADGEALGIRTPTASGPSGPSAQPPGRGLLVTSGRVVPVQVAEASSTPPPGRQVAPDLVDARG